MWEQQIRHDGLNAYRVIRGRAKEEVELKARLQLAAWNERWQRVQSAARVREERLKRSYSNEERRRIATERTTEAQAGLKTLEGTLTDALSRDPSVDWDSLKDHLGYAVPQPQKPIPMQMPPPPSRDSFRPVPNIIDRILASRRRKKEHACEQKFLEAEAAWNQQGVQTERHNKQTLESFDRQLEAWEAERSTFLKEQAKKNVEVDRLRESYFTLGSEGVSAYADEVLSESPYPDWLPRETAAEYVPTTGILVVDFELPNIDSLPKIKEVKYVIARAEFQEVLISEVQLKRIYDELLYQICLRTMHELFQSDRVNALKGAVFNGWVRSIDKTNGAETHLCVMSVQVGKGEFLPINLSQVDPKKCYKGLKGVSGTRLTDLSPVRPVLMLNREDDRFVPARDIAAGLDDKTNLAAMDWLDFENLIREIFEKEFSSNGGEVKITQASRDGGVDAIAFDPDPIRGGKIVIQAKRYTNTVGVSAVRDLYGTVHNEGATKGILVTTSDYGPDAYEFAKGKPLTLLSGSELLYLLGKHGYRVKIDLAEAKQIVTERDNRQ